MFDPTTLSRPLSTRLRGILGVLMGGYILLAGSGLFLLTTDGSTMPAAIAFLVHLAVGTLCALLLLSFGYAHGRAPPSRRRGATPTGASMLVTGVLVVGTAAYLVFRGSGPRPAWVWWVHVIGGFALVAVLAIHRAFRSPRAAVQVLVWGGASSLAVAAVLVVWNRGAGVGTRAVAMDMPRLLEQPFLPSAARTPHGGYLTDSTTIDDAATCADCHPRITREWQQSAHRHASMTNPFYRDTTRALVERYPRETLRFCAGCHDPALLFTGKIADIRLDRTDDPDSLVGLSCSTCHAIEPSSILGNAHFIQNERRAYAWEASENALLGGVHDLLLRAKPQAHAASLTPQNIGESTFCATCHKAQIPPEINRWKWIRAQDEYDEWHDSGVSRHSIRSFYHPENAQSCQDCHMPLVADAQDAAADGDGRVHSHLFAAANTALPFLRADKGMIEETRRFLRTACTVDVTAVVLEGDAPGAPRRYFVPAARTRPAVRPGEIVEVQIVVRNRGAGHPFPAGTTDSNEAWLAFEARIGDAEPFYVSGALDEDTGRLDPTAEVYRSYGIDRDGRRVVSRLGPDVYTRVYTRRIGPGAADVVRYRFRVPEDADGELRIGATLRYRKFMREFIDSLYPDGVEVEHRLDDGRTVHVALDTLPVIDMAEGELVLPVTADGVHGPAPDPAEAAALDDLLRVNDLGIAHLLQIDLQGAERYFEAVTRIDPGYADGWVNLARTLTAKGDWTGAFQALERARAERPGFLKARFFEGEAHRRLTNFEQAELAFRDVLEEWPEEREALRRLAEVLYEQDECDEALEVMERLLAIDPESPIAWGRAVRCFDGLEDEARAKAADEAFDRHRADEDEIRRRGDFLTKNPDLQRLAQKIHAHVQPGLDD